ncbi:MULTISPECIES: SRPBCC family protein [Streptomyces]|uniref:Polyketide cyclase n=2 Tax=Streptomyces TaxID=1883 RepID=A0A100Y9N3_9ACTN|nr:MULTISPECIES: SRPBCC domain-containing protein [Streptomyces]KUH40229.1 polyketide cyclase [Streptomyces kanasensis]UUS34216.1 SRPBCC domain-containing protein [Streptomyces changanensis]
MAVRQHVIKRPPAAVWDVLSDRDRYCEWVVGTHDTEPLEGDWPEVGSSLRYTVALGPARFAGSTVVRRMEPPHRLELEVKSEPTGTARVAIEIAPWGDETLVVIDEHPLRGPGARLHNAVFDALLQLRHRRMLRRLAEVVEGTRPAPA